MQLNSSIIAFVMLIHSLPGVLGDCLCTHGDHAGSWDDHNSPAGALSILVVKDGEQYDASVQGHMGVHFSNISGNVGLNTTDCNNGVNIKGCLLGNAEIMQSWDDTWWLWDIIHCEDSDGIADFRIWA